MFVNYIHLFMKTILKFNKIVITDHYLMSQKQIMVRLKKKKIQERRTQFIDR